MTYYYISTMGLNESKMRVSEPTKPEPAFTKSQIGHLIDPRSPSAAIDRTPIQVRSFVYFLSRLMFIVNPVEMLYLTFSFNSRSMRSKLWL